MRSSIDPILGTTGSRQLRVGAGRGDVYETSLFLQRHTDEGSREAAPRRLARRRMAMDSEATLTTGTQQGLGVSSDRVNKAAEGVPSSTVAAVVYREQKGMERGCVPVGEAPTGTAFKNRQASLG